MSFPEIDYFNWRKIMHNSSHVSRAPVQFIPKRWAQESALGVVNHQQHVDALPDKYDNCRHPNVWACQARGGEGPPRQSWHMTSWMLGHSELAPCRERKEEGCRRSFPWKPSISIDWLCAHVAKTNYTGREWGRFVRLLAPGSNSCCFIFSPVL